jgi:transcriptional regulator with XRE-family HTH domain
MAALRAAAGLTFREIETKAKQLGLKISSGMASEIENGRRLPSGEKLRAFVLACGAEPAVAEAWCEVLRGLRGATRPVEELPATAVPADDLWRELCSLPFVDRMRTRQWAPSFPRLRELVQHAVETLSTPYETAAAHTLHGVRHAVDVVQRISELLGEAASELTLHETQLLILGAFFHDVGRVPGACPVSRARLARFRDEHPSEPQSPEQEIEDFCRWDRQRRLDDHLRRLPEGRLQWDRVPIREILVAVCSNDPKAPRTFLGADVAFCAGLLRLATRIELCGVTPADDIYRRLSITRRRTPRTGADDVEWREQFGDLRLLVTPRKRDYEVVVEAMPLRPLAEFDLRRVLDTLEAEFTAVLDARPAWTERWRDMPLPRTTDREEIKGVGYTYEKLTFELARDDVLELFTGAQLYGNAQIFVRELLQNAMDAVRLRALLDRRPDHGTVAVTAWGDDDSVWFRIDDDGVGMDLSTVRDYFLRIGRSYYNSADLARELRHNGQGGASFRAISRFGIGIMSCFMLGDRVEVSTRRFNPRGDDGPPLRMSLSRQEDFVVLRRDGEGNDPMPTHPQEVPFDFRDTPGTSVAVHIDARQHHVRPGSLLARAEHFHFAGAAKVTVNGKVHVGREIAEPLIDGIRHHDLKFTSRGYKNTEARFRDRVRIWTVPLNLTAASPDPRVQGQLVAIMATAIRPEGRTLADMWPASTRRRLSTDVLQAIENVPVELRAGAGASRTAVWCTADATAEAALLKRFKLTEMRRVHGDELLDEVRANLAEAAAYSEMDVAVLAEVVRIASIGSVQSTENHAALGSEVALLTKWWWGHNGITLPVRRRSEYLDDDESPEIEFDSLRLPSTPSEGGAALIGNVEFFDDLRPDLSLARDEIQTIPFALAAGLTLAVRRAVPPDPPPELAGPLSAAARRPLLDATEDVEVLGVVLEAIEAVPDAWAGERVLSIDDMEYTCGEIAAMAASTPVLIDHFEQPSWNGIWVSVEDVVACALAHRHLDLVWRAPDDGNGSGRLVVISGESPRLPDGLRFFRPLMFMRHEVGDDLWVKGGPFNIDHPFSRWIVPNAAALHARAPGHFVRLRQTLNWLQRPWELRLHLELLEDRDGVELTEYLPDDVPIVIEDDEHDSDGRETGRRALPAGYALLRYLAGRVATIAPDLAPSATVMASLEDLVRKYCQAAEEE